jgi:hypothetical protein
LNQAVVSKIEFIAIRSGEAGRSGSQFPAALWGPHSDNVLMCVTEPHSDNVLICVTEPHSDNVLICVTEPHSDNVLICVTHLRIDIILRGLYILRKSAGT